MKTIFTSLLVLLTLLCVAAGGDMPEKKRPSDNRVAKSKEFLYSEFNMCPLDIFNSSVRKYSCNEGGLLEAELSVKSGTSKLQAVFNFPKKEEGMLILEGDMEIKIFLNNDNVASQTIQGIAMFPKLYVVDANFDGNEDFYWCSSCGAANACYDLYIYNEKEGKFSLAASLYNPCFIEETKTVWEDLHFSAFEKDQKFYHWNGGELFCVAHAFIERRGLDWDFEKNEKLYFSLELETFENGRENKYKAIIPEDFMLLSETKKEACVQNYFYVLGRYLSYIKQAY